MGLIVIEGPDGSGKSTQIRKLHDFLSDRKYPCRLLHFPRTDSPVYGELIARFLRGELGDMRQVNPYLVALMYAGDRFDCKSDLEQWLRQDTHILLDRYVYSNVAYQCAKLHDPRERQALRKWILHLEFDYYGLPKPDLNIYLNVPFAFTHRNLTGKRTGDGREYLWDKKDIHEADLNFQEQVRKVYEDLSDEKGFLKIECGADGKMLSVEEIFELIVTGLKERNIKI
ncbi:MAG: dTMP kinase [Bacteroidales bacterium]|jgi:dTMP kinase|nr:dTMP kinase [Bacteroidales bacterium]